MEDGRQKTEDRRQKTEDGRRKTERLVFTGTYVNQTSLRVPVHFCPAGSMTISY